MVVTITMVPGPRQKIPKRTHTVGMTVRACTPSHLGLLVAAAGPLQSMTLTGNAVPTLVSIANNQLTTTQGSPKGSDKQAYRVQNVLKMTEKWTISCTY